MVAHGVRNILDVALNAEDEMFTYDNTDEHDWMGRFTHMVEAGFYGYPHDFIPRRPYTLWMMEDYGAARPAALSPTTKTRCPRSFRAMSFSPTSANDRSCGCAWNAPAAPIARSRRKICFPNPPGDFRPVGITLGPDGKSIYICDWHHRDEKAKVSVGRLLKLTWTGPDHSAAQTLMVSACRHRVSHLRPPPDELVRGFSHPSHNVRLTAQRRLAELGSRQVTPAIGFPIGKQPAIRNPQWNMGCSRSFGN